MNRMNRLTALLLAAVLVLAMLPLGASAGDPVPGGVRPLIPTDLRKEDLQPLASMETIVPQADGETSGTCGDNLTWSMEGNTLTISGTGDMYDYQAPDHPAPWSQFHRGVFDIIIEDGVTSIGQEAFTGFTRLMECHIPASVSKISRHAFYESTGGTLIFWGDAPQFDAEAFADFKGWACHFRPWEESVTQSYGGDLTWKQGWISISRSSKQLYTLNEEIKAEDFLFHAYYTQHKSFQYTPTELLIGDYDNSTLGQKTVLVTADGFELTHTYYVTDGSSHLDLITVEYEPILYYSGRHVSPKPVVKAGDKVLNQGEHYDFSIENNFDVGTDGSFTITGMGIYEGFEKTYPFAILKYDISNAHVTVEDTNFYGLPMAPEVYVELFCDGSNWMLFEGKDYELIYEDNVNVGTGTVRVVGKGGYCGSTTQTFEITQGETTLQMPGAYNGSAYDEQINDEYYYTEGILCPGIFTGKVDTNRYHLAYYYLYRVIGEELELVTEYESPYGKARDTAFTYDFTDVYNSTSEEGGETYLLAYTWLDMDYDVYSGALLMFVPARVPDATVMDMASLPGDGDFRREYLAAAGVDGVLDGLTITSSDETVASIESGIMTLKHPGAVTITANAGNAVLSQDLTVEALDLDDGVIFSFDPTGGSANVIYDGLLLEAGTDYAINVKTDDGITEVWAEGKGLFSGLIMRQFDSNGDAIGHTHAFENACDADCETCDFVREQGHSYTDTWTKDMDGHWHACSVCGDKTDYAEHTLNDAGECTVCGPLYTPGDLDGSLTVNEDDAIYLLQHVLLPDFFPVYQPVDYDHNGLVNEDDAIYLLQHVLLPEFFPLG